MFLQDWCVWREDTGLISHTADIPAMRSGHVLFVLRLLQLEYVEGEFDLEVGNGVVRKKVSEQREFLWCWYIPCAYCSNLAMWR